MIRVLPVKSVSQRCLIGLLLLLSFTDRPSTGRNTPPTGNNQGNADGEVSISCAPSAAGAFALRPAPDGRYAPVFPGWGHYHYPVSTASDSAQFYFDQGLNLYYSYHMTESAASFKEAARRDSNCIMAYWGEALAMGPYYNYSYYYKMPSAVLPIIDRLKRMTAMTSSKGGASPLMKELDLIAVVCHRYDTDTTAGHRTQLNREYSESMKALIGKYPGDADIKALYVDGMMTEHAWDMWDSKGVAKPWTPELIRYCEEILAVVPRHPAALHYHIHLVEASLHPEAALHSADVLQELMPGVAHMVHMASHMYQRTGLYSKGVTINDRANAAAENYSAMATQLRLNSFVVHYHSVEAFCALNGGMYEKGMQIANKSRSMLAQEPSALRRTGMQYHFMMPAFVLVRLGKWKEVLDLATPDPALSYAVVLSNFARGLAYVRTGNIPAAQGCLDSLRARLKAPELLVSILPQNAAIKPATVAEAILAGEILFGEKKYEESGVAFARAIECEDGLTYGEPKDWPLPARHYAGACLLKRGQPAEAEKLYREDLAENPGNGWGLLGLYQSLLAQRQAGAADRSKEMDDYKKKYMAAFAAADEMPQASAY